MSLRSYPSYQTVEGGWFESVPSDWDVVALRRKLSLRTDKSDDSDLKVALEDIEGWTGRLIPSSEDFSGEGVAFEAGDVLFGKLRPYLAKVWVASNPGAAVGDFHVLATNRMHPRFVGYLMRSAEFIGLANGSTYGAKMPRVGWDFLASVPIPVPTGAEQEAIASFLDRETAKIDALVAEQERLIALLKEKRQAVISQAVTKGLDPSAAMKDSGVEWLGDVPAHWDISTIGYSCPFISYGFTNPMPTTDVGPFMLTANDIGMGRIEYESARTTSDEAYAALTEKSRPQKGDILLTKDGTLGRVALHDGTEACINQSVALLRCATEKVLPEFIATALVGGLYQDKMLFDAGGTTIKHIYITRLSKMAVALPPVSEQREITDYLMQRRGELDNLIAEAATAISLLKERRAALISAAVTGQIDVRGLAEAAA